MDRFIEAILESPSVLSIIVISIVSAIGLQLGKLKILNISLGITFVFFTGILIGHFNLDLNKDMLSFARNFGLVLFVYALLFQDISQRSHYSAMPYDNLTYLDKEPLLKTAQV